MDELELARQFLTNGTYVFDDYDSWREGQYWLIEHGKVKLHSHFPEQIEGRHYDLKFKNVSDCPIGFYHLGECFIAADPDGVFTIVNVPCYGPMREKYLDAILAAVGDKNESTE